MIRRICNWLFRRKLVKRSVSYREGYRYATLELVKGGQPIEWDSDHPFDRGVKDAIRDWERDPITCGEDLERTQPLPTVRL